MRRAFAIEAVLALEPGADPRAVGGAVTLALCGGFVHPGPCRLAPHHTSVEDIDAGIRARIVAACDPEQREAVVRIVTSALQAGRVVDPDGVDQRWTLRSCDVTDVLEHELGLASRLTAAP